MAFDLLNGYPSDELDPCQIAPGSTSCQFQVQDSIIETDPNKFTAQYVTEEKDSGEQNAVQAGSVQQTVPNPPVDIVIEEGFAVDSGDEDVSPFSSSTAVENREPGTNAWDYQQGANNIISASTLIPANEFSSGAFMRSFPLRFIPPNAIITGIEVELETSVFGAAPTTDELSLIDCGWAAASHAPASTDFSAPAYATRSSVMAGTGIPTSQNLLYSLWFKMPALANNQKAMIVMAEVDPVVGNFDLRFALYISRDGSGNYSTWAVRETFTFGFYGGVAGQGLAADISFVPDTWSHLCGSINAADEGYMYQDDAALTRYTNLGSTDALPAGYANHDFNTVGRKSANNPSGELDFTGCLGDLFVDYEQDFDLSVEANRRMFITAGGDPVDVGSDGSTPTGTAPNIFMGNEGILFPTNLGTGGSYTGTGTFAACATTP